MGRKVVSGHSQKTGRVLIDNVDFCVESLTWTEMAEEEETTNSCSAGYAEYEYGNKHVEGSLEATWDINANPFDAPPNISAGSEHTMRSFIHSAPISVAANGNGPNFSSDNVKFNNAKITIPSKGKVTISVDFKTSGPYTLPTGGDSSSGG